MTPIIATHNFDLLVKANNSNLQKGVVGRGGGSTMV